MYVACPLQKLDRWVGFGSLDIVPTYHCLYDILPVLWPGIALLKIVPNYDNLYYIFPVIELICYWPAYGGLYCLLDIVPTYDGLYGILVIHHSTSGRH